MTTVFVEPSHDLPVVSVLLAFRSGAVHDPESRDGLARITGRMLRRGAEGWTSEALEEQIDLLGADFGTDAAYSATSVHFEVIKRSVEPCVDLVATMLASPTFDQVELDKLLREAEAELIEARDSDRSLCSRAFRRTLFAGHPYGRRVAGTVPALRSITRDDVAAFYRRHYTRKNAVVAVSGDIDVDEGKALAERVLAGLPEGERVADIVLPPKAAAGRHLVLVDKAERTQTQMAVGGLGTHPSDDDHIPLMIANTAFGGTFTSRLMQEIRAKRGWSYGASSRVGFDRQRDAFMMWTAPGATDAAPCLALELELLHDWIDKGLTADEIAFVKSYLVRSHAFEIDTARKRVQQRLEVALLDLPEGYYDRYVDRIRTVTAEEANAAVRKRISEDDLVVSVVGTNEEIGDALAAAIPRLASKSVLPFDFE